jgi:hypothetical protein
MKNHLAIGCWLGCSFPFVAELGEGMEVNMKNRILSCIPLYTLYKAKGNG